MVKKRVCAYVRVAPYPMPGTPDTRALPAYYEALIKQNIEWEFVGVYVDEANTPSTSPALRTIRRICTHSSVSPEMRLAEQSSSQDLLTNSI